MVTERVAFVWVGDTSRAGSGYLIRSQKGDHVFTAAHVVEGVKRCQVRLHDRSEWLAATVLWRDEATADVAVLVLDEAVDASTDLGDEPDWASCRDTDVECRAVGYPRFQRPEGRVETEEFRGRLRPKAGHVAGRLNLVHTAPARDPEDWKGMSGAALFAEQLFVGVITQADDDRLYAWPLARLLDQADFVDKVGAEFVAGLQLDALWPRADHGAIDCIDPWTALSRPTLQQPSALLRAHHETVPFADDLRTTELASLGAFTRAPGSGVTIVTGLGGSGKTRLMLEWCKRMRAQHWLAGFISPWVDDWRPAAKGETPRFLVIDYAETQTDRVAGLIHALLQERGRPQTKLVLLARRRGPWVGKLREDDRAAALLDASPGFELAALDPAQRVAAYEDAYRSFSTGAAAPSPMPARRHERLLIAHMQALLSVLDDEDIPEGREPVLARVLVHERKFWHARIGQRLDSRAEKLQEHADSLGAALVLLDGVPARREIPGLVKRVAPELKALEIDALSVCFAELYAHGDRVAALEPDLLGEQLVYETLKREVTQRGPEALAAWLDLPFDTAFERAISRTLTVLTRLGGERDLSAARDWLATLLHARGVELVEALGAGTAPFPGVVLADAVFVAKDIESAEQMSAVTPDRTLALREVAVATWTVIVDVLRPQAHDEASRARLAASLHNLGTRLSELGQREGALEASREAVGIRRELAQAKPDVFLPDLATSLNGLGIHLSNLGELETAIEASREAIDIQRELAQAKPDTFLPGLAIFLNNLGIRLNHQGQLRTALKVSRESVDIRRKLAPTRPDAFLAGSLSNQGVILSKLGDIEGSLKVSREAVDHYQKLATASPDAFLPSLANSLNNLGIRLSEMGQREAALEAAREAVNHHRKLADTRPSAFLPSLANSLDNLGIRLSEMGQREAALEASREAVNHYRELADTSPSAFLPSLATSLDNLGNRLYDLGQWKAALEASREAVDRYRELVNTRPDAFLPYLAASLNNLGNHLSHLGQREAALEASREAVGHYRELADTRPHTFLPHLAGFLSNLGIMLSRLEQREAALEASRESVDRYRELVNTRPDAFLPYLAASLNSLGNRLGGLGQQEAALKASREALDHYRKLANTRPDAFLPGLASSLGSHAALLFAAGQSGPAANSCAEGLRAALKIHEAQPHAVKQIIHHLARNYHKICKASDTEFAEDLYPLMATLGLSTSEGDG